MQQMRILFIGLLLFSATGMLSQTETNNSEVSYFYGSIYKHTPDIGHLITGHPQGVLVSFNRKTYGEKEWQRAFNYPDYGFSFQYQDFRNKYMGENFAIAAHYNFYFLKRKLVFRISQGIGMTTNPYDKETNYKNNAFGSRFMSSNLFLLNYKKERIVGPFGLQAGFIFTHFSNGRIKSPNSGINTYGINLGVNYTPDEKLPYVARDTIKKDFKEPIRYNIVLRTGISESQIVNSGQKPFYHFGLYADKRIGRKSAMQLGTDIFLSQYLKEYIKYRSVAYPEEPYIDPNTDYKRVSLFVGHELFISKISVETQVGYYIYKPFDYEIDVYQRVAAKYYFHKKWFTGISLKSHAARAEAIELAIGIRL